MSPIKECQAAFEQAWAQMYKVYRPFLTAREGDAIVHRPSAMKGLAWNLYLQGRTDEGNRLMARTLAASRTSAALRKRV